MTYKDELIRAMEWLAEKEDTVFTGQATVCSGHSISGTLVNVPDEKKIELPVFEETQVGMATGMALEGNTVITCFPRFDFFILSLNQVINHLDKAYHMSRGDMDPRVIIRVAVGAKTPLDAGPQHTQNHTEALRKMATDMNVVELLDKSQIFDAFKEAYERDTKRATLIIEHVELYGT